MDWESARSDVARVNGVRLHYREAGSGPALLLLHGWPETSYTFRKVLGPLAAHYRVVAPDLRGLGASDRPATGYDVRTLATDVAALIEALGLERPYLVGHDWGGLIARRFALDRPGELARIAILDVAPHEQVFANLTADVAKATWHFYFNAVPDLPERLVAHDVEGFLRSLFRPKCHNPGRFIEECIDEYTRAYSQPGALRAGFAYYQAMFAENRALDRESAGRMITEPLLVLWGNDGGMGGTVDVLSMWRAEAAQVEGRGFDACGHYLPEEAPQETVAELLRFGRAS